MGINLYADVFYGLVERECPWRDAPDFDPEEDWEERLRRRAEAASVDPASFGSVVVSRDFEARQPWWVAVSASLATGSDISATPVGHDFTVDPVWDDQLRRFCELLDIPWREPAWCMASRAT